MHVSLVYWLGYHQSNCTTLLTVIAMFLNHVICVCVCLCLCVCAFVLVYVTY